MIMQPSIIIIDYGVGNTQSVSNAIKFLGYKKLKISCEFKDIENADVIILPGVGAFEEAIENIKKRDLIEILNHQVVEIKKPILGICVGMQLLATYSEENGVHKGLNWISGRVKKMKLLKDFLVPHVGWNDIIIKSKDPLFTNNSEKCNFYFDHSYYFECDNEENITAFCDYDIRVTAAVQKDNIFGVQFHPEKSHNNGLKMFRGFFNSIK